jgi:hypothetical protein
LKSDCSTELTADPTDAYFPLLDDSGQTCSSGNCVYRQPWATALASAFNTGSTPHFYNMDNEIDIWGGTHFDIHPQQSGYSELANTYLLEAGNLKTWDPAADSARSGELLLVFLLEPEFHHGQQGHTCRNRLLALVAESSCLVRCGVRHKVTRRL